MYCAGKIPGKNPIPQNIPKVPASKFKGKGWKGMGDWLGTGRIAPHMLEYRPFKEARSFARSLNLSSEAEWIQFCNGELTNKGLLPKDIPKSPWIRYKGHGWISRSDWLGSKNLSSADRVWRNFSEARAFVHTLSLKSQSEWFIYLRSKTSRRPKLPSDIPKSPHIVYADKGWAGIGDWIGTGTVAPQMRKFRPFEDARDFARKLNLKTKNEWVAFTKGQTNSLSSLPVDVPAGPSRKYSMEGWISWADWLGNNVARKRRKKA
jgi:hypothetical protein